MEGYVEGKPRLLIGVIAVIIWPPILGGLVYLVTP